MMMAMGLRMFRFCQASLCRASLSGLALALRHVLTSSDGIHSPKPQHTGQIPGGTWLAARREVNAVGVGLGGVVVAPEAREGPHWGEGREGANGFPGGF